VFGVSVAKFRDVISQAILSKKCCTSICPIVNSYVASVIFIYVHGCNRNIYGAYILSNSVHKKKVLCQMTSQNKEIH
jgi:hypothetical protein